MIQVWSRNLLDCLVDELLDAAALGRLGNIDVAMGVRSDAANNLELTWVTSPRSDRENLL